jgi:general secretion pathway protein G
MTARRAQGRREGGFTLVELLVVIGILALLAGLLFPAVTAAQRRSREKAAKAMIERLTLALEQYASDFGDYPPTSLAALGVATNGVNEGNESLVRCLSTRKERGPYFPFEEKDLANTDGDKLSGRDPCDSTLGSKELFEVVDPWGNPYIYFHNRDYRGGAKLERYVLQDGTRITCRPHPNQRTGQYPGVTSFVIWSVGADGKNDDGEGDDIASWK